VIPALDRSVLTRQLYLSPGLAKIALPNRFALGTRHTWLAPGSASGRTSGPGLPIAIGTGHVQGRLLSQVTDCPPTGGFTHYIAVPLGTIDADLRLFHDSIKYLPDFCIFVIK
jgi:hypothetical protein